jgi:hypothetical protein
VQPPPITVPPHVIDDPLRLLAQRATLPGAFGYDRSAHALRVAAAKGVPLVDRLALALHGSWMVNSRATSPVFRRWLEEPARPAWNLLDEVLRDGPEGWLALGADERAVTAQAVALLCGADVGVAALSKVLALLYPQTMCLMDDHAIAYLGLAHAFAPGEEKGTAGPALFAPTLDAFSAAVVANADALTALATAYPVAVLDGTQALDRVLWVASYGERFFRAAAPR